MKTTVMIIEDNDQIRQNTIEILNLEGFNVLEAPNGGTALGLLRQCQPDLIVCDINMPDFNGYQILQYVRKNDQLTNVPFLFLTARNDKKSMRHGMNLGADDYLIKPFSNKELVSAIQSRLERNQKLVNAKMNEVELAKQQLTRLVSHELRTPLVSIVTIEQIISRKIDDLSRNQIKELINSWQSSAHRLQHLVEQMVLLTKLDSGAIDSKVIETEGEICDVWKLLDSAISMGRQFAHRNPEGKINAAMPLEALTIRCDQNALLHALAEIISNALDFSEDGTTVIITTSSEGGLAEIAISDNGPGMTTRRLKRALQPFEQIDREKQEQQGIGLGLPIARKVIRLHNGRIKFDKIATGGTKVVIQLPLMSNV